MIVLITDGKGNRRSDEELRFADRAKARNISIITVGITDQVNSARLRDMATDRAFVMIDTFDALQTMTQNILDLACQTEEITTTTTSTVMPERTTATSLTCTSVRNNGLSI